MPEYPLRCECGWEGELIAPMSEREGLRCPNGCDCRLETRYEALRVATEIQYNHGRGAESLTHGVHPSQIRDVQRACPDVKLNDRGGVVYDNKSHKRRSIAQLEAAGFA